MKRSLLFFASFLLFSLFFFMFNGERTDNLDVNLKGESFIEGLRIIQKKNGISNWILIAKRADISKDGDEAKLIDLVMEVVSRGITIYAEKGLYNLNTRKISVDGAVNVKGDSYSITTGDVEIDSSEGLLRTNRDVFIEGRKFTLQGKGMEIENNDQKVRILKDVKAIFNN